MNAADLDEYCKAQKLAAIVMGKTDKVRGRPPSWKACEDPLAHHELTELIYSFRERALPPPA